MAIGERIHFFRKLRNMTQKQLGLQLGFPEKSADVRIAQYETGTRTPKANMVATLTKVMDIIPQALSVPDIDSEIGLLHTLFTLEDRYGFTVDKVQGHIVIQVEMCKDKGAPKLYDMLCLWQEKACNLRNGEINSEEYDSWKYLYTGDVNAESDINLV